MGTVAPHAILTQVLHALNGKKDECLLYNFHVCDTFVVIALKQSKLRTIALQIAIELLWCLLCRLSSLAYSICPSWVCFSIENQSSCTLQTRVRLDILARFFALKTSWSWLRTNLKRVQNAVSRDTLMLTQTSFTWFQRHVTFRNLRKSSAVVWIWLHLQWVPWFHGTLRQTAHVSCLAVPWMSGRRKPGARRCRARRRCTKSVVSPSK